MSPNFLKFCLLHKQSTAKWGKRQWISEYKHPFLLKKCCILYAVYWKSGKNPITFHNCHCDITVQNHMCLWCSQCLTYTLAMVTVWPCVILDKVMHSCLNVLSHANRRRGYHCESYGHYNSCFKKFLSKQINLFYKVKFISKKQSFTKQTKKMMPKKYIKDIHVISLISIVWNFFLGI